MAILNKDHMPTYPMLVKASTIGPSGCLQSSTYEADSHGRRCLSRTPLNAKILLFDIAPTDPLTYAVVVVSLAAAAVVACSKGTLG